MKTILKVKLVVVVLFLVFTNVQHLKAQKLKKTYEMWGEKWWTAEAENFTDDLYELCDIRRKNVKKQYDLAVANKDFKLNKDSISALHIAVACSDLEAVKMFIESGADPNLKTNHWQSGRGFTPLFFLGWYRSSEKYSQSDSSYKKQDVEIARLLISAGADVNKVDNDKSLNITALKCIVRNTDNYPVIKVLLEAGADPNFNMYDVNVNRTPIIGYAKSLQTYKLLLAFGGKEKVKKDFVRYPYDLKDPEILDYIGNTAYHAAALDSYANVKMQGVGSSSADAVKKDGKFEPGKFVYFETTQAAFVLGIKPTKYLDYKEVTTTERLTQKQIIDDLIRPKETMRRATFIPTSQVLMPCGDDCKDEIRAQEAFFREMNK